MSYKKPVKLKKKNTKRPENGGQKRGGRSNGYQSESKRFDESANIKVFEKGPYNAFANCGLPYYVGGIIPKVIAMFFFSYLGKRSFSF